MYYIYEKFQFGTILLTENKCQIGTFIIMDYDLE